jgi:hypothetical protein
MKILIILFFILISGCATQQNMKMLNTIDRHTNYIYSQCKQDAENFPVFYPEWKGEVEPQLIRIQSLSKKAREENWPETKIRAEILPEVKAVHNEAYKWGMKITERMIP